MNIAAHEDPRLKQLERCLRDECGPGARVMALGLLEGLLHFTAKFVPDGDLSGLSPQSIADWIDWRREPDVMMQAFRDSGYLDENSFFSDWHELVEWRDDA